MTDHSHAPSSGEIGKSRRRVEDDHLIRGLGRYPDDLGPPDTLQAVFVRSPYPHARITRLGPPPRRWTGRAGWRFVRAGVADARPGEYAWLYRR